MSTTSEPDTVAAEPAWPAPGSSPVAGGAWRYPGSPPFQDTSLDRLLFRGRADQADEVLNIILSTDLMLLYAASGHGKTSLLNAGVVHHLRERGYWPITVRLNDPSHAPLDAIRNALVDTSERSPDVELLQHPAAPPYEFADDLWDLLNAVEMWSGTKLLEPVLIFDQFEELFTLPWSEPVRRDFIAQFGEVVRGYRVVGRGQGDTREGAPPVKVVLSMREDQLGELEEMASDVPQIMRHRFRLGPLDRSRAEQAIREPALIDDPRFRSRRFGYTDAAVEAILDFLESRERHGAQTGGIDPSQLQLVCQHAEQSILPARAAGGAFVEITEADLGGRGGLEEILRAFYGRVVDSLDPEVQARVRSLCEEGLINRNGRRLSLEEGEIGSEFGLAPPLLGELVERRLLRADARVGSVYYELAHDTLVEPILADRLHREQQRSAARSRRRGRILFAATTVVALAILAAGVFLALNPTASEPDLGSELESGEPLGADRELTSPSGEFRLIMQTDGNVVLYDGDDNPLWSSGTQGNPESYLVMQGDGNLVVYTDGQPIWASGTAAPAGATLTVHDDGFITISAPDGTAMWRRPLD